LGRFSSPSFIAENSPVVIAPPSCVKRLESDIHCIFQAAMITAATLWAILIWVCVAHQMHVRACRRREDEARWHRIHGA
jgi:hypothetical protein